MLTSNTSLQASAHRQQQASETAALPNTVGAAFGAVKAAAQVPPRGRGLPP